MNTIKKLNRVPNFFRLHLVASTSILTCFLLLTVSAQEYLPGIEWEEPAAVTPGKTNQDPPSDAVILFNGVDTSGWNNAETWKVTDGSLIVGRGMISTKETFGDCQLHVEWSSPLPAKGNGQGRGNSGVFFGPYEIQVLDSFENTTYFDGQAAAIYKQTPPLVNVAGKPGGGTATILSGIHHVLCCWKSDRTSHCDCAPQRRACTEQLRTAWDTPYNRPPKYSPHPPELPIRLQDHKNPVRFRNIWVRKITPIRGTQAQPPAIRNGKTTTPLPKTG